MTIGVRPHPPHRRTSYAAALTPSPIMRIWLDSGRSEHQVLEELTRLAGVRTEHDIATDT